VNVFQLTRASNLTGDEGSLNTFFIRSPFLWAYLMNIHNLKYLVISLVRDRAVFTPTTYSITTIFGLKQLRLKKPKIISFKRV